MPGCTLPGYTLHCRPVPAVAYEAGTGAADGALPPWEGSYCMAGPRLRLGPNGLIMLFTRTRLRLVLLHFQYINQGDPLRLVRGPY